MNRRRVLSFFIIIICFATLMLANTVSPSHVQNSDCTFYVGLENTTLESLVSLWVINEDELHQYTTNTVSMASLRLETDEIQEIQTMSVIFEGNEIMLSDFSVVIDSGERLSYYPLDLLNDFEFWGVDNIKITDDGRLYIESQNGNITMRIPTQVCEEINALRKG